MLFHTQSNPSNSLISGLLSELERCLFIFIFFWNSKMKPLAIDQQIFSWFGVSCTDTTPKLSKKMTSALFVVLIFGWEMFSLGISVTFFLRYISIDLEQSLYALFQVSGSFVMINAVVIILFSRHKIARVFKGLQSIYEASKQFVKLNPISLTKIISFRFFSYFSYR